MSSFEVGLDQVARLVRQFGASLPLYRAAAYKDAHVRQEFIDPLFAALGWDVRNERGATPQHREVIVEDSLTVEGQRSADYAFCVGTDRKFYVEAKKPGVNLQKDTSAAFQLRRYGWSAGLVLSILTDFEEFAVYDCRIRPSAKDKATVARETFYTFQEYPDRWREIWDVFSREAVWDGAFDRRAQAKEKRRGTARVDNELLKEIEGWREELARNIAIRNPKLGIDELNDAVQRTIDRIVFLRMAEDRGIEKAERLKAAAAVEGVYPALMEIFRKADRRYNSGLFSFGRGGDSTTPGLTIDDKVLRPILSGLYFPKSPYEFSVMPAEILGSVYERFLGKAIRLTTGHHAKVEEKPEVKKSGVVYTPAYIVRRIVEETLAPLVRDRSPEHLDGFRIIDPACGSGSFLLQAYQYVLNHYLGWYAAHDPTKYRRAVWQKGAEWRLTTEERKRILTSHVFGTDIDAQAVEVTKLSLLLKVLEGENAETLGKQMALFETRALPSLERNIKCGNSLIGPDFFSGRILPEREDLRRIKPFDWSREFPDAMRDGGFDCVIGNPPYIRIQTMQEWAPAEVEIYKEIYATAAEGNYDIYVAFVEKGLGLLKPRGRLGFILPHKFMNADYGEGLRGLLAKGRHVAGLVHFGHQQVFENASTYTCLLFLHKVGTERFSFDRVSDLQPWRLTGRREASGTMPTARLTSAEWYLVTEEEAPLFDRLRAMPVKLENVTSRIFQGIKTSADEIYIVEERERRRDRVRVYSPAKEAEYWLESDLLHPLIKGGDSRRYMLTRTNRLILFPYVAGEKGVGLIAEGDLRARFPLTHAYLRDNKKYLEERERGEHAGAGWYRYGRSQALDVMPLPKLFTPDIAPRSAFSFDEKGDAFFTGGVAGGYGLLPAAGVSPKYLLGVLNSLLLEWLHFSAKWDHPFSQGSPTWHSSHRESLRSTEMPRE